jgi:hypothetical protein
MMPATVKRLGVCGIGFGDFSFGENHDRPGLRQVDRSPESCGSAPDDDVFGVELQIVHSWMLHDRYSQ